MTQHPKTGKRGRRAPKHSLEWAIGAIDQVHSAFGASSCSRLQMAEALGYGGISGAVTSKIGALTHFGLAERIPNGYKVSPLALQIITPKNEGEFRQGIAEAARHPVIFRELIGQFSGQGVPVMLANILTRNYGVPRDKAESVSQVFQETLEYAGLIRNGVIVEEPFCAECEEGFDESEGEGGGPPGGRKEDTVAGAQVTNGKSVRYTIPLPGNQVGLLELPSPANGAFLPPIRAWLDILEGVLPKDEDTPTHENES